MKSFSLCVLAAILLLSMGSDLTAQTTPAQPAPAPASPPPAKVFEDLEFTEAELPVYDESELQRLVVYPPLARQNGLQGVVTVQFVLDTSGRATRIEVIQSDEAIFNDAATEAIRALQFRPAYQKGRPVPVRMTIPIRFFLVKD